MRNILAIVLGFIAFNFSLNTASIGIVWVYTKLPFGAIITGIICFLIFAVLLEIISLWVSTITMMIAKAKWSYVITGILIVCDAVFHGYQFFDTWWYLIPIAVCAIQFIYLVATAKKLPISDTVGEIEKNAAEYEHAEYFALLNAAKAKNSRNLKTGIIMAAVAIVLSVILTNIISNWLYM